MVARLLTFAVMDNWKVLLSYQGHPAMIRGLSKQDVWCAGRIRMYPSYSQILSVSGYLPNVRKKDRDVIESLLAEALEKRGEFINLVWM